MMAVSEGSGGASAWVADIQSKIPDGDYKLFGMANNVTKLVKANRTDGIQIFRHALPGCGRSPPDFPGLYVV